MARQPRNTSVPQLVVVLLAVLVPIAVVTALFTRYPEPRVTEVDYRPVAEQAAASATFDVLVPANLPEGWVATRVRWTPAGKPGVGGDPVPADTWQLGFLSPGQVYVALDQRDGGGEPFVASVTRDGRPDGEVTLGPRTWGRYLSDDGRTRSLVSRERAVTIVSADLPYEALQAFAGTLEPA